MISQAQGSSAKPLHKKNIPTPINFYETQKQFLEAAICSAINCSWYMPIVVELVGSQGMQEILELYNTGLYPATAYVARPREVYIVQQSLQRLSHHYLLMLDELFARSMLKVDCSPIALSAEIVIRDQIL
jgi:hypothetical protein